MKKKKLYNKRVSQPVHPGILVNINQVADLKAACFFFYLKHSPFSTMKHMKQEIKCGVSNRQFASNRLETRTGYIYLVLQTIWKYFILDNWYFSAIASLQLSTHPQIGWLEPEWSPTGCFSTFIPLMLCFLLDLVVAITRKCTDDAAVREWNRREKHCVNKSDKKTYRNVDIYPGDIISLKPGEIADMDLLALSPNSTFDTPIRVSHSNINGESQSIQIQPIPFVKDGDILKIIENDPKHISSFRGLIGNTPVDYTSLIVNGARLVSTSNVMGLVVACGPDRKLYSHLRATHSKPNRLNTFIASEVMKASLYLLSGMILVLSLRETTFQSAVKSWMVLNGVFPFSIKILLSLVRGVQSKWFLSDRVSAVAHTSVDEISQVDWIVFDKTGTLTGNKLELVAAADENGSVPSLAHLPDRLRVALPYVVCRNRLGTPETEEDQILADACARMGWTTRFQLVPTSNLHYHTHRPMSSQVFSTGLGEMYRIVSKGSVHRIARHLHPYDQVRLERAEIEMMKLDPSLRVLAIAIREFHMDHNHNNNYADYEKEMHFIGLVGFRDNLVVGVESVMEDLRIRRKSVAILTGDRQVTANAVAAKLGIKSYLSIGPETDLSVYNIVPSAIVGYGMTPEAKKRVVDWLQLHGKTCLAIGDGYNDVEMIESARVGVALTHCIPNADVKCASVFEIPSLLDTSRGVLARNQTLTWFTMWKCFCVSVALFWVLWTGKTHLLFDLFTHQGFHVGWSAVHSVLIGTVGTFAYSVSTLSTYPDPYLIAGKSVTLILSALSLFALSGFGDTFVYFLALLIGLVNGPLCWVDRRRPMRVLIAQTVGFYMFYAYIIVLRR